MPRDSEECALQSELGCLQSVCLHHGHGCYGEPRLIALPLSAPARLVLPSAGQGDPVDAGAAALQAAGAAARALVAEPMEEEDDQEARDVPLRIVRRALLVHVVWVCECACVCVCSCD